MADANYPPIVPIRTDQARFPRLETIPDANPKHANKTAASHPWQFTEVDSTAGARNRPMYQGSKRVLGIKPQLMRNQTLYD